MHVLQFIMHFSYVLISEQFNDISSLNNMAFNLFIHHFYYWFVHFSGHLNGHNNDFLVLCYVYDDAVPSLVRTVDVLKINV